MPDWGSLILSDGEHSVEMISGSAEGFLLADLDLPIASYEITSTDPSDGEGSRPLRKKPNNSTGSFKFTVSAYDSAPFWYYLDDIQGLVASMQARGGTIRYEPPGGGQPVTFDIREIEVSGLPQDGVKLRAFVLEEAAISFACAPYGRLDPVVIVEDVAIDGPVGTVELENVPGHVEALGELIIGEESGESRSLAEVGLAEVFDPTEEVSIGLPDLVLTETAGVSSVQAGSVAANVAMADITTLPVTVCRTGPLTHSGLKRVRTRVYTPTNLAQVRLAWRIGDGPLRFERWVDVPDHDEWFDLSLAVVALRSSASEGSTWEAVLQARTTEGYSTLAVDMVTPFPADVYMVARADESAEPIAIDVLDDFDAHTSGDITGKTAPIGGVYSGGGNSNDFAIHTATGRLRRTAVSDSADDGRYAGAGTSLADCRILLDMYPVQNDAHALRRGVYFRFVDANNFGMAVLEHVSAGIQEMRIYKVVGGTYTQIGAGDAMSNFESPAIVRSLMVEPRSDGTVKHSLNIYGDSQATVHEVVDDDFMPGGPLASGTSKIYDERPTSDTFTRDYENYHVVQLDAPDRVLFADRTLHVRHNGVLREASGGGQLGRVANVRGNFLKIPPSTRSNRKSLLAIRARRQNIDNLMPDSGVADELRATLTVTPRVLLLGGPR